ncbi:MAG: hypothetical protein AAB367_03195 [Patescibacteria group bacterium]
MAQLEICAECGKHGRIVMDDGRIGPEFISIRNGIEVIQNAIQWGLLSVAEGRNLEQAVTESSLPATWIEQPLRLLWLANEHKILHANGIATEADRHAFLHQPVDETIIPPYFAERLKRQHSTQ